MVETRGNIVLPRKIAFTTGGEAGCVRTHVHAHAHIVVNSVALCGNDAQTYLFFFSSSLKSC